MGRTHSARRQGRIVSAHGVPRGVTISSPRMRKFAHPPRAQPRVPNATGIGTSLIGLMSRPRAVREAMWVLQKGLSTDRAAADAVLGVLPQGVEPRILSQ